MTEPSKGSARTEELTVHLDHPGAQFPSDTPGTLEILRLDVVRQPVRGVVGDGDRLILRVEWQDRQHGSEDLLASYRHFRRDIGEHSGPDEVPALGTLRSSKAARNQPGAFVDSHLDEALDLVELDFRSYGTDVAALVRRKINRRLAGDGHRRLHGLVVCRALDQFDEDVVIEYQGHVFKIMDPVPAPIRDRTDPNPFVRYREAERAAE